ncbi:MAG: bifunctional proline dehydrogenase/L-glutamate gamma-semialdehyde dehydrogenase PutA [Ahrensia sp.]|nr:bifunctional proline dehydrogenase/L-glutamate gamma-semialdehyde dehydrogenase PutA [Ahrensia sp.]
MNIQVSDQFVKSNDESNALKRLIALAALSQEERKAISKKAADLVRDIRAHSNPSTMELFLAEYGLSSDEGVALMCLAEALLRVPDAITMDALIEDKIAPSKWGEHLGQSHSPLVNASTWALFLTGKVLDEPKANGRSSKNMADLLRRAVKRLGEPVIRQAVSTVMKELGRQFVLGQTIEKAMARAAKMEAKGFTYSYDMLGEAARTEADAQRYLLSYSDAIGQIAKAAKHDNIRENPGISIKLSALHPRYETMKKARVMNELVPRALSLAILAKSAGIGLNIDAEEAGRLELSLDIIDAILADTALKNWDGFGIVVQAYNKSAPHVIDQLYAMAQKYDRRIMIRLVKGAYWDTEIKHAQTEGLDEFPVFTQKASTDVSYIACAKKLLSMTDRIYPQFATHNAHSVAAILHMAGDKETYEFQRLHGMGEALHDLVLGAEKTNCRIYAPVGAHKDLLAYLVRRLLENGANSSFVNQIVDETVAPEVVGADPFVAVERFVDDAHNPNIALPFNLFAPSRINSRGWDLENPATLDELRAGIDRFADKTWKFEALSGDIEKIFNPATGEIVGTVKLANLADVKAAAKTAKIWDAPVRTRAAILRKIAALYEDNAHEIFALLTREAGKTINDCVGELREAVDFLRFYAGEAEKIDGKALGTFVCISPWNFPLAIFTGQIGAALAAGNAVLAKPAETTPLIANFAVELMHRAGVPKNALFLLPGTGAEVGSALCSLPSVNGICFTGSTPTAQKINRAMAQHLDPMAPLIAETGGINAMIVDSTALPEQAVADMVASAFQSAGQRCSALRVAYVQEEVAPAFIKMLQGAMDELVIGNPADFATDVGPVIDAGAKAKIDAHILRAKNEGRLISQVAAPEQNGLGGTFVGPALIKVRSINDVQQEIFGPVLHIATFKADAFDRVINEINATGYGLTFGFHSRIDDRVQHVIDRVKAGNIYISRNQIGAIVGSQPFGGEGLSGTGPKAGGPKYLYRFIQPIKFQPSDDVSARQLPGPTGESNRYSAHPRGTVVCLGPMNDVAQKQAVLAAKHGCAPIVLDAAMPTCLRELDGLGDVSAVIVDLETADGYLIKSLRQNLAARSGPLVPILSGDDVERWLTLERHVCIDTTAAGGNTSLMAGTS